MKLFSFRNTVATVALMAASLPAYAGSIQGNYDVTFKVSGGGTVLGCVTLVSSGASAPYRDLGTATLYFTDQSATLSGTYVAFRNTVSVAVQSGEQTYLVASGQFSGGQSFDTAVTQFSNNAIIVATATFKSDRVRTSCAGGQS